MSEPSTRDKEAVKQAILNYVEGVYETDPSRIERSIHPELAKRGFFVTTKGAEESTRSFAQFLEHTRTYDKDGKFPPDAPKTSSPRPDRQRQTYRFLGHRLHAPREV